MMRWPSGARHHRYNWAPQAGSEPEESSQCLSFVGTLGLWWWSLTRHYPADSDQWTQDSVIKVSTCGAMWSKESTETTGNREPAWERRFPLNWLFGSWFRWIFCSGFFMFYVRHVTNNAVCFLPQMSAQIILNNKKNWYCHNKPTTLYFLLVEKWKQELYIFRDFVGFTNKLFLKT